MILARRCLESRNIIITPKQCVLCNYWKEQFPEEYFFFQMLVESIYPLFYLAFHHYAMLAYKVNYLGRKSGKVIAQD
jgi:hypothetical protein